MEWSSSSTGCQDPNGLTSLPRAGGQVRSGSNHARSFGRGSLKEKRPVTRPRDPQSSAARRSGFHSNDPSTRRNPLCRVFGETAASSPRPGPAPPELTRLRAPRNRWGHSSPGRKVRSSQRAAVHSSGLARLHGNAPAAPRRPLRDNPASTEASRVPHARSAPLTRLQGNEPGSAHCVCAGVHSSSAGTHEAWREVWLLFPSCSPAWKTRLPSRPGPRSRGT